MKRPFLALTLLLLAEQCAIAAPLLAISPSDQSVPVGAQVNIAVNVSGFGNGVGLGTYDISIGFDPSLLSYASTSFGNQLDLLGLGSIRNATLSPGSVDLFELSLDSIGDLTTLQAPSFWLATLTFDALAAGNDSPITLSVNALGDAFGAPLAYSASNGTVSIVPEATVYVLMLAGLSVLGLVARRRSAQNVAMMTGALLLLPIAQAIAVCPLNTFCVTLQDYPKIEFLNSNATFAKNRSIPLSSLISYHPSTSSNVTGALAYFEVYPGSGYTIDANTPHYDNGQGGVEVVVSFQPSIFDFQYKNTYGMAPAHWSAVNVVLTETRSSIALQGFVQLDIAQYTTCYSSPFAPPGSGYYFYDGYHERFCELGSTPVARNVGPQFSFGNPLVIANYDIVDPVPLLQLPSKLLSGPGITTNATDLADKTQGRPVQGVAADGVAQVVIRIPANSTGDEFKVSTKGCAGSIACVDENGLVFNPQAPPADIFGNQAPQEVTVQAVDFGNGPVAIVAYRAPADFARPGNDADKNAQTRSVFLSIKPTAPGADAKPDLEIKVLRPPVVLVHGLWASSADLGNLAYLQMDALNRFTINRVDYGSPITRIRSAYPPLALFKRSPTGSSLGFEFGAYTALKAFAATLDEFRKGGARIPVAAARVNVVSHSMGSLIARTAQLHFRDYFVRSNYAKGYIHKIVSIGSPHLGSPFATELLKSANTCMRNALGRIGNGAFDDCPACVDVDTTVDGQYYPYVGRGAIGDLKGNLDGLTGLSKGIRLLKNNFIPAPPIGYITGQMSNSQLQSLVKPVRRYQVCTPTPIITCYPSVPIPASAAQALATYCPNDPLATIVTNPTAFSLLMSDQNDGVVPVNSQQNGLPNYSTTSLSGGVLHSPGLENLYHLFLHPKEVTELTHPDVVETVIDLLNTPVTDTQVFFR